MLLCTCEPGLYKIKDVYGGYKIKRRLTRLGLTINGEVEVLDSLGPLVIKVKKGRILLGRNGYYCNKVEVEEITKT